MDNKLSNSIGNIMLESYTRPVIKEVKNADWVSYGENNDYFEYLIDMFNDSTTNNAIITGMVEQIYGNGITAKNANRKADQFAEFKSILKPNDLKRIINDLKLLGNAAVQVIYSDDKSYIESIKHFQTENIRSGKANEEGDVTTYYYAPDWTKVKKSTKLKEIPAFGFGKKSDLVELYYLKPYKSGCYYYASVDYHGCLQYCELESEISNFHINNVMNGFMGTTLINFNNGVPQTEQEKREIENKIKQKFTGSSNAGRFVLAFNDNKESAATVETLSMADVHNQFEFVSSEAESKIMMGHKIVSPMLLGIKDQTGLGNNADELRTASMLFEATAIRPFRNMIIDMLDELLGVNEISLDLEFISLNPFIDSIEMQTEEDIQNEDQVQVEDNENNNNE